MNNSTVSTNHTSTSCRLFVSISFQVLFILPLRLARELRVPGDTTNPGRDGAAYVPPTHQRLDHDKLLEGQLLGAGETVPVLEERWDNTEREEESKDEKHMRLLEEVSRLSQGFAEFKRTGEAPIEERRPAPSRKKSAKNAGQGDKDVQEKKGGGQSVEDFLASTGSEEAEPVKEADIEREFLGDGHKPEPDMPDLT